jgi:hypothetical protein
MQLDVFRGFCQPGSDLARDCLIVRFAMQPDAFNRAVTSFFDFVDTFFRCGYLFPPTLFEMIRI